MRLELGLIHLWRPPQKVKTSDPPCGVFKGTFWLINLYLIYRRTYRKNLTSGISNTTVNLIDDWKKMKVVYEGSAFIRPLYLFNSWLRPLGFKVSSSKIKKFSLCFNKLLLVSLLKVLLRICSIIIRLAFLLKIWSFIAKGVKME